MDKYKVIASIADIHIGVKSVKPKVLKQQLNDHFIVPLKGAHKLDGIFLLGDIMHTIVSLNSESAEVFNWLIDQVYQLARQHSAVVIVVKGTISHDNDQLENIKHYINNSDNVDFRIYDTVEETTIWDNFKLLILPDVRVKQLEEVDKYFGEKNVYDMIIGHGTIDAVSFAVSGEESEPMKTYVYSVDKLLNASKGPILFGHIHQFQHVNRKFYYAGPFTLLERGGINGGFVLTGISTEDTSMYKVEQYINPDSASYTDISVTKKILSEVPLEDIIEAIDDIIADSKENDIFTLRITRDDELSSSDKVMMLEARYRSDSRFAIVKKILNPKEEADLEERRANKSKYAYLMDQNMEMSEIMYRYFVSDVLPSLTDNDTEIKKIKEEDFARLLDGRTTYLST